MNRRRVYVAYTGGTIGMKANAGGYAPEPGFLSHLLENIPELRDPAMPEYVLHEYSPLLDSSNMTPAEWARIADDIFRHYDEYDGFVVLHGTDTMAYTASALSFMLKNLAKPVVLTGSQIPLCEIRNDARQNIIDALSVAAFHDVPEVCLLFGGVLLRGNRSVKVSAGGLIAFASPNFPPIGRVGVQIRIERSLLRPTSGEPLSLRQIGQPRVGALRLFPGIDAEVVANFLRPPLEGLVLECYGVGNAPDRNTDLLRCLGEAVSRGVVIVVVTQCLEGRVDLGGYATGNALRRVGVISGADMSAEAAMTKMFHLLSQNSPLEEVCRRMQEDLRGELTV